jgi:heme/copper-type cytochrome/quinol oxidase subunit 2
MHDFLALILAARRCCSPVLPPAVNARMRKVMNLHLPSAALLIADVVKVFNPQSPQARAIFDLSIVVIVVMVVIFAVAVGIVMYALLGFPRWREVS